MPYQGLGEMFEGDSADMSAEKFPLTSMGGRAEGLACAAPGARTPIGVSGILGLSTFWNKLDPDIRVNQIHGDQVAGLHHCNWTYYGHFYILCLQELVVNAVKSFIEVCSQNYAYDGLTWLILACRSYPPVTASLLAWHEILRCSLPHRLGTVSVHFLCTFMSHAEIQFLQQLLWTIYLFNATSQLQTRSKTANHAQYKYHVNASYSIVWVFICFGEQRYNYLHLLERVIILQ
jgi:hypothetical protein